MVHLIDYRCSSNARVEIGAFILLTPSRLIHAQMKKWKNVSTKLKKIVSVIEGIFSVARMSCEWSRRSTLPASKIPRVLQWSCGKVLVLVFHLSPVLLRIISWAIHKIVWNCRFLWSFNTKMEFHESKSKSNKAQLQKHKL